MHTGAKISLSMVLGVAIITFFIPMPSLGSANECTVYTNTDGENPDFIQEYLDKTEDLSIMVCGGLAYYANTQIEREGEVCSYTRYSIIVKQAQNIFLERAPEDGLYVAPTEIARWEPRGTCRDPKEHLYTTLDGISHDEFVNIMRFLHNTINSPQRLDREFSNIGNRSVINSLMMSINSEDDYGGFHVEIIRLNAKFLFWKRYMIIISDPDSSENKYGLLVDSYFDLFYNIVAAEFVIT